MKIKKIGLGTVQFGLDYGISNHSGVTPEKEVEQILQIALSVGIDTIDTAYAYGNSETILGNNNLEKFSVITKFLLEGSKLNLKEQIAESKRRLNINNLHGLLAHRPGELISNPEIWDNLLEIRASGAVKKIGFSFNSTEEIESVLRLEMYPDIVQVPFNYIDHRFLPYFQILKEHDCEIHSRSSFLQGIFFVPIAELSEFFNPAKKLIGTLQKEFGPNLPGALLSHCLNQENIDRVIIGINNSKQLLENIQFAKSQIEIPDYSKSIPEEILTPSKWKI